MSGSRSWFHGVQEVNEVSEPTVTLRALLCPIQVVAGDWERWRLAWEVPALVAETGPLAEDRSRISKRS